MKNKIINYIKNKVLTVSEKDKLAIKPLFFPTEIKPIIKTKESDVFIIGFPKSGNSLLQHILTHLIYGINGNISKSLVELIVPDIYANSHYFRINDICYFKSHNLPEKRYKKVIYIMRDGREALLSYYHMMKNMGKDVSLEDLYSGRLKLFNVTWQEHIQQWEENPYNADILWIKFEDLKRDKLNELKRICVFLNINKSFEELNDVIKFTSLEYMKELEKKNDWVKLKELYSFNKGSFVRQGKIDSYKNKISNVLLNKFNNDNQQMLKKHYYKK